MPTIIETLLPTKAIDYVAVFDSNFNQVFPGARSIKAVVKEQAKLMEHPLENGAIVTDHRVILPVEIELSMILPAPDYADVYRTIRSYYFNSTVLMVQTRSGIYENQIIAALPHQEDPDQYNALTVALSLKQIQFVTAMTGVVPVNPTNTTTVNRGTQQGATPTAPSTTLNMIFGS